MVKIDTRYYDSEQHDGKNLQEKRRKTVDDEPYRNSMGGIEYKKLLRYMPFFVAGAILFLVGLIEITILFITLLFSILGYLIQSIVFLSCGLVLIGVGMKQRNKVLGIYQESGRPAYIIMQSIAWLPLCAGSVFLFFFSSFFIFIGIIGINLGIVLFILGGIKKREYLRSGYKESAAQKDGAALIPP
jgi:hypothetical protein